MKGRYGDGKNSTIMVRNDIWIRIEFNTNNQYEGTDELLEELREICPVQAPTKWYPAACSGLELVLALNFNLSLTAFINNVLIPGAEFAGVGAVAKRVWKCFEKFYRRNKAIELKKLELTFDDVTLLFKNVMSHDALLKFYCDFPEHLCYLEGEGIKNICNIRLPYISEIDEATGKVSYREWSLEDGDDEVIFWMVDYERGLEKCFYNPQKREVIIL